MNTYEREIALRVGQGVKENVTVRENGQERKKTVTFIPLSIEGKIVTAFIGEKPVVELITYLQTTLGRSLTTDEFQPVFSLILERETRVSALPPPKEITDTLLSITDESDVKTGELVYVPKYNTADAIATYVIIDQYKELRRFEITSVFPDKSTLAETYDNQGEKKVVRPHRSRTLNMSIDWSVNQFFVVLHYLFAGLELNEMQVFFPNPLD